jgi:hypothetical protein
MARTVVLTCMIRALKCNIGISITGNRLFGPQPRTSTYVCIWNIDIGKTLGLLTEAEGRIVLRALRSFSHNYADPYNAPAKEYNVIDDWDGECVGISLGLILTECIHLTSDVCEVINQQR